MRPRRLQIEGFACFKERQELDLTGLELFAIIGPNGAGKSSLLDAITLALYGGVPRVGDRYGELISHGRDRMAVAFDFSIGQRVFRVTRARRRRGAAQAQLEELVSGDERPLADGVREVDKQIKALLGLPYEAFTQAVVLPQGEFWKFLRSQPRERRELLRELLRHQIYERMRQAAAERAGQLAATVQARQRQLDEDYAGATTTALADLRARAEQLAVEAKAAEAEFSRWRQLLQDARARHAKTRELRTGRELVQALEAAQPEIQETERRVDAARRVAPVIAVVRGAEEAERAAESRARQAAASGADLASAREAHAAERRHLETAQLAAKELPALRDRIRRLDEVRGLVQARDSARGRRAKSETERQTLAEELGAAERTAAQSQNRAKQIEREAQSAVARVADVGYDADLDARLEAVRDSAAALAALRPREKELASGAARAAQRAAAQDAEAATREADANAARVRLGEATRALEEADRAVRDAEQKSAAALLREGLRVGAPCPVCGKAVAMAPRPVKLPQLAVVRAKRQQASDAEEQAGRTAAQTTTAAAAALATAEETRAAAERAGQEAAAVAREITRREEDLAGSIGRLLSGEAKMAAIEARVQAAVERVVKLRQRHEQAFDVQRQAEKKLLDAQLRVETADRAAEALRGRLDQVVGHIRDAEADLMRLDADISTVTRTPDPLAEREELAGRQERIEAEIDQAQRAHQAAEARLAAVTARTDADEGAAGEATRTAEQARQRARQAAREAGFPDEKTAEAAALPDDEAARLATEAERYRRDLHAAVQRVTDLAAELAGREVSDGDLAAVEIASAEQERVATETRREADRVEIEVQNLAKRVERATGLARELTESQREHGVHRRLADDLRGERFQAFVLDESFRDLAKGGSARLMSLSGRYTFEYNDDSFYVVDHDNAREKRSADTLSGGETFLASLALALELSEQVQGTAAAVPLDSLFIDEGFGTLDPEALETVAGAIEGLPRGGRTVGIITHVAELAARLPARVVVEKRADGSRVRVEIS